MSNKVRVMYVDLDHTLLCVNLPRERFFKAILNSPIMFLKAVFWLFQGGRARLKMELAERYPINAANLPFNEELLDFLKEQQKLGVRLVLATAAPHAWAQVISDYLGIFEYILATDVIHGNLNGIRKLQIITKDARGEPFGYVGDSYSDRPIFEAAALPVVVGKKAKLAGNRFSDAIVINRKIKGAKRWWMALRPHQWSKNILIFVPMVAAHQVEKVWAEGVLAFSCFSMVASALYILNDLCDIDLDRQHPEKRRRSLAAGTLEPSLALLMAISLLVAAAVICIYLPFKYGIILLCYGITNVIYSYRIKKIAVLDIVILAFLYSIRVFAGGAACKIEVSTWLAALTFFLALSLAHLKRYVEVSKRSHQGLSDAARPCYTPHDMVLLASVGIGSGLISVLVLALYITSFQVYPVYKIPGLLFVICILQFYWIERMWMLAFRGKMQSDPIAFIVTDKVSYAIAFIVLTIAMLAANY